VLMTKAKIVLSTRFLGTLRYVLSIIFWYPEICDIRQTFGPGGAGYRRFYCSWNFPHSAVKINCMKGSQNIYKIYYIQTYSYNLSKQPIVLYHCFMLETLEVPALYP
jgi:hypothetical protein